MRKNETKREKMVKKTNVKRHSGSVSRSGKRAVRKAALAKKHPVSISRRSKRFNKAAAAAARAAARQAVSQTVQAQKAVKAHKAEAPKHITNMKFVNSLLENEMLTNFLTRNVGRHAMDIIKQLNQPKTDDKLAVDLEIKVNEVRRVLNVLDGYGVARYDTHKNAKGWLTFNWYVDTSKLTELNDRLALQSTENDFSCRRTATISSSARSATSRRR